MKKHGEIIHPTRLAHDTIVVVGLAGFANRAGDTQLPLELVAGVAQARLQQSSPGRRPAVGLARLARDVVSGITQRGYLLVGPTQLLRAEQRLLQSGSARTEGVLRTRNALRVQPIVAVVCRACVIGIEPRFARLTLLADHVA